MEPAPNYLVCLNLARHLSGWAVCFLRYSGTDHVHLQLRDLVHMFISRIELLPEDESINEHQLAKEEEAAQVKRDETGSGLFGAVFKEPQRLVRRRPIRTMQPGEPFPSIRDEADGVNRCPQCLWELEDGECLHCGYLIHDDFSGSEDDSEDEPADDSDLDHDIDAVDIELSEDMPFNGDDNSPSRVGEPLRLWPFMRPEAEGPLRRLEARQAREAGEDYTENDSPDPDGRSHQEHDTIQSDDEDDEMNGFVVDDDEEDDNDDNDDDDDDDDEGSSTEEGPSDSEAEDTDDTDDTGDTHRRMHDDYHAQNTLRFHGIPDESDSGSETNITRTTQYSTGHTGSDDESREATPLPLNQWPLRQRRAARVVPDEDEDEVEHQSSDQNRFTVDLTRSSPQPPQDRADRRRHLQSRRNARDHRKDSGGNRHERRYHQEGSASTEIVEPGPAPGRGRGRPPSGRNLQPLRREDGQRRVPAVIA